MTCSTCGVTNESGRKFCKACGAGLGLACRSCGATNSADARFCGECGATLPGSDDTAPATQRSAERRLVSVLFVDIVGFSTFAESRDPEIVRETLSSYFAVARRIVDHYGGTLEKFIGDAVMAVWGAPTAHEDDAERAVLAGLDIVEAVPSVGHALAARGAVMTGQAAVTLGASGEGLVAGDLVNTAARLQAIAPSGTVLVGAATRRAAERAMDFEPFGAHEVKGRSRQVDAWLAHRGRTATSARSALAGDGEGEGSSRPARAPIIGRDDELLLLQDLLHATVREQRARLVSIVGPAGVGKTRLAEELARVTATRDDVLWLSGRSPSYGEGITFWALGEVVRRAAGLAEGDDEDTTRAAIARLVGADEAGVTPALLALLGAAPATGDPRILFSAWRTFLEHLADRQTVVLVFEDLHWADPGLLEFIEDLVDWARASPIFVLGLARPELHDRRPDWGARRRSFTSLVLEPLAAAAMGLLVERLLPGTSSRRVTAIVDRAEGIPLYAAELVRGREAVVAGDGRSAAIPETLTALIAARLDGLPSDERGLVLEAAVLGQTFSMDALSTVTRRPTAWVAERLAGLVRRELVAPPVDPRSPERGQYAFTQALVREVAYSTLSRRDRVARHLAVAAHLETVEGDEVTPIRAAHYLAALGDEGAGDNTDAVRARAQATLRAAGERAYALGSPDQAIAFLERAASLTTDAADRAALAEAVGHAASAAGRPDRAVAEFELASAAWQELGERSRALGAVVQAGRARLDAYRVEDGRRSLDATAEAFADMADDPAMRLLNAQRTRAAFLLDDDAEAIRLADMVLAQAGEGIEDEIRADTLVTKGAVLAFMGRSAEGLALLEAGGAAARAAGSTRIELRALGNRAIITDHRDPRESLHLVRTGLELAARRGDRRATANLLHTGAWNARRTGEWSWAAEELEAILDAGLESGDRLMALSVSLVFVASRGEPVDARLREIETLGAERGDRFGGRAVSVARATAAFASGDLARSRVAWHAAVDLNPGMAPIGFEDAGRAALWSGDIDGARQDVASLEASTTEPPLLSAIVTTLGAGIAALDGRRDVAIDSYRAALAGWQDLGLPWGEAVCAIDMAVLLGGEHPDVARAVDRARSILTTLEARPFLERLEAATG